ncbi:MAG TPA: TonB-dependent receptor, partial [Thermoanaerobaculia bacterium]|nr:TonB-dependent receptor [Thermoanaerobaculia bacterium]
AAIAQTSSGSVTGRVVDASGAALPGVTVTATNTKTGFNRSVVTDAEGHYTFPALPIGTYNVLAELAGFTTVTTRNVEVQVATASNINVTLKQAPVAEQITVTAEAPLVATTPAIGTVVSEKEIENLPLNGRQFANLGTLAPGTSLAVNSDPTKPDQLVIAVNGGTGRNMNYLIDGGDNTDDTIGGALQNFNLEAVQEFKVQTQQYKAEFGRSTAGVLTVVTKGGTNDLSGSAFEYGRRRSLNAITETEKLNGLPKGDYKRDQYGFALGGPIVKDKAHFFVTWEHTKKDTSFSVDPDIFPQYAGQSFPLPLKNDLVTAKSTVDLTAKQFLQVRFGYQKVTEIYGASPVFAPDALGDLTNKYSSILAGHNWQIGSDKLNEFLVQWSKFDNTIVPESNLPTFYFGSGGVAGQNPNTPQDTHQKKRQFKDDFSWSSAMFGSHHDFKTGLNYVDEPVLSGGFSSGTTGQFTFNGNDTSSTLDHITFFSGNLGQSTPIKEYNAYLQDDWAVNPKLTVNLGLRYDLWRGYDLDQTNNPIWRTLTTQTKYNESYLQDFRGSSGLKNDTNNWSPRLGFSYDLHGDSKNIVRAGVGRYYQMPYTNATILFPASAIQSTYGVSYDIGSTKDHPVLNDDGTVFHYGQPLPKAGIIPGGALAPNEVASPTLAAPYSDQASLGYSWQAMPWIGFSVEGVHINYRDLPYRFRANPVDPTTGERRFSDFGDFRIWYGKGEAKYQGFNLGTHARLGDKLTLQGFYTYSKTTGNVLVGADEFRITAADWQPGFSGGGIKDVSVDPFNPQCSYCFGPLASDARHRVTMSAVYNAPYGVTLAGMYRYHSGTPFMAFSGIDLKPTECSICGANSGDGYKVDLPNAFWAAKVGLNGAVTSVNSLRGPSFQQFDVRLAKDFGLSKGVGVEVMLEAFNIFNEKNPTGLNGRMFIGRWTDDDAKAGKIPAGFAVGDPKPNPSFGQVTSYAGDPGRGEQRLFQVGARVHF